MWVILSSPSPTAKLIPLFCYFSYTGLSPRCSWCSSLSLRLHTLSEL